MLATMETYKPQNLNVYMKFDTESDVLLNNSQFLRLDQVLSRKNVPIRKTCFNRQLLLINGTPPPFLIGFWNSLATRGWGEAPP